MGSGASESVSAFAALLAGVVSFVSPCVLPIVPGYLSFISGVNVAKLKDEEPAPALTRRVFLTALAFVLGFSTVFVSLGAAATLLGALLQQHKRALGIVGGAVIVVLGLHTMGVVKIDWLLAEKRAEVRARPLGLFGAYVVGLAFAFGWTPCIGPILAAILFYASQQETVAHGVLLLSAYSLGLGLPFLAAALAINGFFRVFGRLRGSMRAIEVFAGALLVGVGVLLLTDRLTLLSQYFSKAFPFLANLG